MATYSFYAVSKVKENMGKDGGQQKPKADWPTDNQATQPQSYSSKMMKAIWGQYNRYSVHNFKSNQSSAGLGVAQCQGSFPAAESIPQTGRGLFTPH